MIRATRFMNPTTYQTQAQQKDDAARARWNAIIPKPVSVVSNDETFSLAPTTQIQFDASAPALAAPANLLAERLGSATGFTPPIRAMNGERAANSIFLSCDRAAPNLGDEGYALTVTRDGISIRAPHPAGCFYGIQTLLQLLPSEIFCASVQSVPWLIAGGTILDAPRYAWRGLMLDVARHFFKPDDVKRLIDALALYKINRLHLHLTDDQGWRIESKSWDKLTAVGGSSAVDNAPGGYYTQAEYTELVAYAAARCIVIVPEIDLPGHTNAALAAYPELNCNGVAPPRYTGTDVGFSSLCADKEVTYRFVGDVLREISALTPGPYLHVGGDEAQATAEGDYIRFMERVQELVRANGKQLVGWQEIGKIKLQPGAIAQLWASDTAPSRGASLAAAQGARIILSPASHTYLDMKYDAASPLGQSWAGGVNLQDAYNWDPEQIDPSIPPACILGVEAALWSETLTTRADVEYMTFPRLPGIAEIGWSPALGRSWEEYRERLAAHGTRFAHMGIAFYQVPDIRWH